MSTDKASVGATGAHLRVDGLVYDMWMLGKRAVSVGRCQKAPVTGRPSSRGLRQGKLWCLCLSGRCPKAGRPPARVGEGKRHTLSRGEAEGVLWIHSDLASGLGHSHQRLLLCADPTGLRWPAVCSHARLDAAGELFCRGD